MLINARVATVGALPAVDVERVLHRDDLGLTARGLDLGDVDVRDPDMADLAGSAEVFERAHQLGVGHKLVRTMELVELDGLDPETAKAALDRLPQTLGAGIAHPGAELVVAEPALGGDDKPVIGMERLAHRLLGRPRAIRIRRIEHPHAERSCLAQQDDGVRARRPEAALDGEIERSEANARDLDPAYG